MKRVSVDIGGTFTDCFLVWNDRKFGGKALTTHHNLAVGFHKALTNAFTAVNAFPLTSSLDAALLVTLPPGTYTVQVSGVNGTTGVALIEVYEMP